MDKRTFPCTVEEISKAINSECDGDIAEAILKAAYESFGGGSNHHPAFLEAIAMSLGFGPEGHESLLNTISSSLDGISSAIESKN